MKMDINSELIANGWHFSNKGLEICKEDFKKLDVKEIMKKALDIDLREVGGKFFPDELSRGKLDYLSGAGVVQIQKIKNATAPKYEYGSGAPPLLRLLITDGNTYINCLQWDQWKTISMDTPPGTKIYLKPGKIMMQNNFLLLKENQFNFLGGCVEPLIEKWELNRRLASHVRTKGISDGSGPPPWIPFGKPISDSKQSMKGKNFKALEIDNKETKEEDEAFKQQRLAKVEEIAKAKEGKPKVFGGGKDVKQVSVKNESGNAYNSNNPHSFSNYTKPNRNTNEFDNWQAPRSQDDYRNSRNNRNWSHQDNQRTQPSSETFTNDQSNPKDKRMDHKPKFNSNEFPIPRNHNSYRQKSYNNSHRGDDTSNSYQRNDASSSRGSDSANSFQRNESANSFHKSHNLNSFREANNTNTFKKNDSANSFNGKNSANSFQRNDASYSFRGNNSVNSFQRSNASNSFQSHNNSSLCQRNDFADSIQDSQYSSKFFSKNSDLHKSSKTYEDRLYEYNKTAELNDVTRKMSQVQLHGYDSQTSNHVSVPNKPFLKVHAEVLAKYWEDNEYYRAKVTAIAESGKTCVVHFLDYNNFEEVLVNDVQQNPLGWDVGPISFQPAHWNGRNEDQERKSKTNSYDSYHRSSAHGHERQERQTQRQSFRPSTKLYQPPQQRYTP